MNQPPCRTVGTTRQQPWWVFLCVVALTLLAPALLASAAEAGTDDQRVSDMAGLGATSAGSDSQSGQISGENTLVAQVTSQPVDLQVTKNVSLSQVLPGQQVTYTITYANAGPSQVTDVVLTDNVSALLTSVSCNVGAHTGSAPVLRSGLTCIFDITTLLSGEGGTITITGTLGPSATNGTVVNSTVSIASTGPYVDGDAANDSAAAPFTVIEPELTLVKTITTATGGVDAGDQVRYQIRVSHDTASAAGAMSLDLSDALPAALQNLTLVSAIVSDGATSTNVASSFSFSGSTLSTVGTINLLLNTNGSNDQVLTVIVQGTLRDSVAPGSVIGSSAAVTWANSTTLRKASYTATGSAPNITVPGVLNVTKSIISPGSSLRIGDTVTYQMSVSLVEGTTSNIQLVDTLPAGMTYVSGSSSLNANGMTVSPVLVTRVGQSLTYTTSSVTNPGNVNNAAAVDSDSLIISYQVRVDNVAGNQRGTTLTNDVDATATNTAADNNNQVSATIVEPELTVSQTASDTSPNPGQTVDFTVTLSHLGASDATAHNVQITDSLPAGLTLNPASVTVTLLGGAIGSTNTSAGSTVDVAISQIPVGGSVEVSYQAAVASPPTVSVGNVLTNSVAATWTSLAGTVSGERTGAGGVNDYRTTADRPVTVSGVDMTLTKGDGGTSASPGGTVAYTLAYANAGNQGATGVVLSETVPANTTFNAGASTAGWACAPTNSAGSTCTLSIGAVLGGGAGGSATFAVTVDNPVPGGVTQISNTASVADDGVSGADPVPANNSASDTTPVNGPPDTTITASPPNPTNTSASFSFSGSGSGSTVASFECQIDGGAFSACASPQTYLGLADGSHTFQVRAIDTVGNVDPTPASSTWTIDATAPNTTISTSPPALSNSASASFSFTGSDGSGTGVASFECQIDGGAFSACASPQTYLGLADGPHTFQVRAIDVVGNVDPTPASSTWTIDTTPPPAPVVVTPASASRTNNTTPTVSGTAEPGSTVTVRIDGSAAGMATADASGNWSFTPGGALAEGGHTARATAADAAGNSGPNSNTNTFTVDTTAPAVTVNQAASQADPAGVSPVNFTAVFNEPIAVASFTGADVTIGGTAGGTTAAISEVAPNDGTTFNIAISGMANNGTVTASLAAGVTNDAAGNSNAASTSADSSVLFDSAAPTVSLIERAGPSPTSAASVNFSVVFSEDVTGVAAGSFALAASGVSGASITGVSGSGGSYTVSVSTGAGSGTLRLDLIDDDSIADSVGNALGGTGAGNGSFSAGQVYTIDRAGPAASLSVSDITTAGGATHTFTVQLSDAAGVDVSSLGGGDISVTGPGGFSQLAAFISVDVNTDGTPRTATYQIGAPGGAWDAADSGTYTLTLVAGQVSDTLGTTAASSDLGSFDVSVASTSLIYLPLIANPGQPDLVVQAIQVVDGTISVTIRNQGQAAATTPFWVDLYVSPSPAPVGVNQIWQLVSRYGAAWGVAGAALPLAPGQSLTLSVNGAYYRADLSSLPTSLAAGTRIYAQVDSAGTTTSYGGVLESHEESGGAYNNISSTTLAADTPINRSIQPQQAPADAPMPRREGLR